MIKKIYVMVLVMLLLLTTIPLQPDYLKAEETDTFSPEITSASADPGTVGYGFNITIAPTVTDNQSGVDLVKVNITYPDNSYGNYTMNNTGGNNYEYIFSDTWQTGQYNYTIWSIDNANNTNISSQYSFTVSAQGNISVCTIKDKYGDNETINLTDPPGSEGSGGGSSSQLIGFELLDDGKVLNIWNRFDSYYFDTNSGIQLTNHFDEYWSHNVLMLGYYNNDQWNHIYRTDELSGFNKQIESDNETYVNATLWKDLSYAGYDFRLALRYHLGIDDNELTVIPYIKNLGETIPYTLGFGWEMKDIQIDMTTDGDYINVNGTICYLHQTLDNVYTDLLEPEFYLMENITDTSTRSLYLKWNQSLTYKLCVKSREGQYNAPVTLFIKVGTLNAGQEKHTELFWYDAEQVTYYFDSYDDSPFGEAWPTNPVYMVDGSIVNYASTTIDGDVELCDENNCSGNDLGTISKVELRVSSYYSGGQRDTILRPVFGGTSDGFECRYQTTGAVVWSEWFDITYDPFAPQSWGWTDVVNLDCDVVAENDPVGPSFTLYCSKIELRVTYTPYNYDPVISSPVPVYSATGVGIQPVLNITVSDSDGDNMNISWLSNSSGSWQVFGTNGSVINGTYHQIMGNASENGKWWYWKVNVSDGTEYVESSVYKFYTGCESKIENTGSTDISGFLFIEVQCYSEPLDTWVSADNTISETTFRTIQAGEQLALDTVFNGIVNSSNLPYGNGTYRIYVALRDPNCNVLKWDDVSPMEGCHEFSVSHNYKHGWYKLFKGDGFGTKSNMATRGTAIYNDELYIGTENHDFSSLNLISIGFPAGTRITMANGNYKNIEDIESGDIVKAYDIDNDSFVDTNVTIVYHTSDWTPDYYFKVNDQLSVSPKHLLYVNDTLMRAEDAKVGDYLTDVNCSNVTITSTVNMTEKPSMLYNFGIALNGSEEPLLPNNLTYFAEDVQVYPWASENIWEDPLKDVFLDLISIFLFIFACIVSCNSDGCEVWKYNYDYDDWTQLIGDRTEADLPSGFGDHRTASIGDMIEFDDKLYVGTYNHSGCEIWRYDGSSWEQVVGEETSTQGDNSAQGFGYICNYVAATMEVFDNKLYVGTINFDWSDDGFCQIWRTADGENWYKVVDKGFRDEGAESDVRNAYLWSMEVFQSELYAGTFNIPISDPLHRGRNRGGQIWKSDTGNLGNWEKVPIPGDHPLGYNDNNGFGEDKNYGIRKLVEWGDDLYVGTATSVIQGPFSHEACEIWKYDGSDWTCIVGEDSEQSEPEWKDGFGDYYNKYAWSMDVAGNALWVGTVHHHFILEEPWADSEGCEVWRYDGTELEAIVEDGNGEILNGFKEWYNRGARSLIEYPEGSGNIVVGTLTFEDLEQKEGCEIWIRYP